MKRRDVIKRIAKKAKRAGVAWGVDREGANHTVYSLDGLMIPIPRHVEIDDIRAEEIFKECEAQAREEVVEVTAYRVNVEHGVKYWLVRVPEIDYSTQARHLREVDAMARDLISLMVEVPPDSFALDIHMRCRSRCGSIWTAPRSCELRRRQRTRPPRPSPRPPHVSCVIGGCRSGT